MREQARVHVHAPENLLGEWGSLRLDLGTLFQEKENVRAAARLARRRSCTLHRLFTRAAQGRVLGRYGRIGSH